MKKYFLTILCTIILSTFIFNTAYLCINAIPSFITFSIYNNDEYISQTDNYDSLIELNKSLENIFKEQKTEHNDPDYPALVIHSMKSVSLYSSNFAIIYFFVFIFSISLGNLIYFIIIKNTKGKKLIIPVILVLLALIGITTGASSTYAKLFIENFDNTFDINLAQTVTIAYLLGFVIIYLSNLLYRKIITNKLNKALNEI